MRYLALAFTFCFCANITLAQDVATSDKNVDSSIDYQCPDCVKGTIKVIKTIDNSQQHVSSDNHLVKFPDCNDATIIKNLSEILAQDKITLSENNILELRSKLLARRNFNKFKSIPLADFRPQDNFDIANLLITLKINQGLKDNDFHICVSGNPILKRRIWLLMIQKNDYIQVNIINYKSGKIFSFNYIPTNK